MRYTPSDFLVEELIQFPDEPGTYSYYRVEKHNAATETVRQALAKQFKGNRSFPPAIKRLLATGERDYLGGERQ
jgi:tRNA(Glu) U13 pseudouridine synthase TruD